MNNKINISGWANFPNGKTNLIKPSNQEELIKKVKSTNNFVARGNGMSYGDISFSNKNTIDIKLLNKLISFNEKELIIEWEAGALLSQINDFINPKGYKFFVIPGTKFITLGGAIACDVHGKNQAKYGSFCNHLRSFKLLMTSGEIITCSKTENADFFYATIGGVGLTGIIISAKFNVRKLTSDTMLVKRKKTSSINNVISLFENSIAEYKAAWIKSNTQILYTEANYIDNEITSVKNKSREIKSDFWGLFTTKIAFKLVELLLYKKARNGKFKEPENQFLHPLDGVLNWNKLYPNGFIQVQFLTDKTQIEEAINYTFSFIKSKKLTSFLTTLKRFSGEIKSLGLMSFVEQGYVFSIDIKYKEGLEKELLDLANYITEIGGKFYLAKDSFLKEEHLLNSYKNYPQYKQFINENSEAKIASSFSKRVNLHS